MALFSERSNLSEKGSKVAFRVAHVESLPLPRAYAVLQPALDHRARPGGAR
jgi:hypothetical protein